MRPGIAGDVVPGTQRLDACVRGQHWAGANEAARQLRERLDAYARQGSLPGNACEEIQHARNALRALQPQVQAELQRLGCEIARLQRYRAVAGAYARHDLALESLG